MRPASDRVCEGDPGLVEDLLIAREPDGAVVLNIRTGTYLRLDGTALEIVELLAKCDEPSAAATLAQRHDIDESVALVDVRKVRDSLRRSHARTHSRLRRPHIARAPALLSEWLRLPPSVRYATVQAFAVLVCVEVGLRTLPVTRLARAAGAPLATTVSPASLPEMETSDLSQREVIELTAANWVLRRWIYDATCLRRSLVLGRVLRRHHPILCFGVVEDGDVLAHAWLALDNATIGAMPGVRGFAAREVTLGAS